MLLTKNVTHIMTITCFNHSDVRRVTRVNNKVFTEVTARSTNVCTSQTRAAIRNFAFFSHRTSAPWKTVSHLFGHQELTNKVIWPNINKYPSWPSVHCTASCLSSARLRYFVISQQKSSQTVGAQPLKLVHVLNLKVSCTPVRTVIVSNS